jgi:hypothetical protein
LAADGCQSARGSWSHLLNRMLVSGRRMILHIAFLKNRFLFQ